MNDFYRTRMGHTFYEGTMPRIAAALERIAVALERRAATNRATTDNVEQPASSPGDDRGGESRP